MRPGLRSFIVLINLLVTSVVIAGAEAKELWLDFREKPSEDFVLLSFRAITSQYTHAYLAVFSQSDQTMMSSQRYLGFYTAYQPAVGELKATKNELLTFIAGGPGKLEPEPGIVTSRKPTNSVTVAIARDTYRQRVEPVLDKWSKSEKYQLLHSDCVTFIADVAEAAGLTTPSRAFTWWPEPYVEYLGLFNANKQPSWSIRLSNIDDAMLIIVNGATKQQCGFLQDCTTSLDSLLSAGRNTIQIKLKNVGGPYHYKFEVIKDKKSFALESCGAPGSTCSSFGIFPIGQGAFERELLSFDIYYGDAK